MIFIRHFCVILLITLPFIFRCQSLPESPQAQQLGEDLWGEAGGISYLQAAAKMQSNHPQFETLSRRDVAALEVVFNDLPAKVKIHWNAIPLNEWASNEYGIDIVGEDAEAQTYGYDIYMKGPKSAWTDEHRLETLIHELTHTQQFITYNASLEDFGNVYFREYFLAGQDYETNFFEVEAQNKTKAWLTAVLTKFRSSAE